MIQPLRSCGGEYERTGNWLEPEGDISHISIDFGHSKNKRDDKKQIKIGLGTTNGVVTDAKVLSGNMDDKTYNKENLEDVDKLLKETKVDRNDFYYIADSALFSKDNIKKANGHKIKFITRMPDNVKVAKKLLEVPLPEHAHKIILENAQKKEVTYRYIETQVEYEGHDCRLGVYYSDTLEKTKRITCGKKIDSEKKNWKKP